LSREQGFENIPFAIGQIGGIRLSVYHSFSLLDFTL
jgi:hypothetical protein